MEVKKGYASHSEPLFLASRNHDFSPPAPSGCSGLCQLSHRLSSTIRRIQTRLDQPNVDRRADGIAPYYYRVPATADPGHTHPPPPPPTLRSFSQVRTHHHTSEPRHHATTYQPVPLAPQRLYLTNSVTTLAHDTRRELRSHSRDNPTTPAPAPDAIFTRPRVALCPPPPTRRGGFVSLFGSRQPSHERRVPQRTTRSLSRSNALRRRSQSLPRELTHLPPVAPSRTPLHDLRRSNFNFAESVPEALSMRALPSLLANSPPSYSEAVQDDDEHARRRHTPQHLRYRDTAQDEKKQFHH